MKVVIDLWDNRTNARVDQVLQIADCFFIIEIQTKLIEQLKRTVPLRFHLSEYRAPYFLNCLVAFQGDVGNVRIEHQGKQIGEDVCVSTMIDKFPMESND
jgi:hypothetical protein